jgi:hypothetical protein
MDLEKARKEHQLYDLHTHLLGMGASEFWVNKVICLALPIIHRREMLPVNTAVNPSEKEQLMIKAIAHRFYIDNGMTWEILFGDKGMTVSPCELTYESLQEWLAWNLKEFYDNEKFVDTKENPRPELTLDIVYSETLLLKAMLGYDEEYEEMRHNGNGHDNLLLLENLLSNPATGVSFGTSFQNYVVFNVRKAKFQPIFGITNENLVKMLEWDTRASRRSQRAQTIIARIRNCFSMLEPNGNQVTQQSLDSFRGKFTPCFYPMRYALKDSIYEQQPIILSYLLNFVSGRYDHAGVGYVEFSLGLGDLANARIYPFLDKDVALPISGNKSKLPSEGPLQYIDAFIDWKSDFNEEQFRYAFLAGVPRNRTRVGTKAPTTRRKFMIKYGIYFAAEVKKAFMSAEEVKESQNDIDKFLHWLYDDISKIESDLSRIITRMRPEGFRSSDVVGVDLMSDENGNPFSPFLYSPIRTVLKEFQKRNSNFGIRLHGGENVFRGSSAQNLKKSMTKDILDYNFNIHLLVIATELEAFRKMNFKCRIGHGLAFSIFLTEKQEGDVPPDMDSLRKCTGQLKDYDSEENTKKLTKNWKLEDIKKVIKLQELEKELYTVVDGWTEKKDQYDRHKMVMFEVNTVSNQTLVLDIFCHKVGTPHADSFIINMLSSGLCISLGTDNDGIWPLNKCKTHNSHWSVAFEYCKALRTILSSSLFSVSDRITAYIRLTRFMVSEDGWFKDPPKKATSDKKGKVITSAVSDAKGSTEIDDRKHEEK